MTPRSVDNIVLMLLLAVTAIPNAGCGKPPHRVPTAPTAPPVDTVTYAPQDTLVMGDRAFVLRTILWRDLAPAQPGAVHPLLSLVGVAAVDSGPLPRGLSVDSVAVINGSEAWAGAVEESPLSLLRATWWINRTGPPWGPDVEVTVVVRLVTSDGLQGRLLARHQWIGAAF